MNKFIILHVHADNSFTYTKTLRVDDQGRFVTDDGTAIAPGAGLTISTGMDPRPFEIRPEVRERHGLPPLP